MALAVGQSKMAAAVIRTGLRDWGRRVRWSNGLRLLECGHVCHLSLGEIWEFRLLELFFQSPGYLTLWKRLALFQLRAKSRVLLITPALWSLWMNTILWSACSPLPKSQSHQSINIIPLPVAGSLPEIPLPTCPTLFGDPGCITSRSTKTSHMATDR
ncbi:large ribosomal subunit protein mL49 isoform X2 [Peromyscus maniculatus bairdii]|uniref:large ribosomal subunit protein mL49 isoform X2 n=1 Tax=Peromyscus maniculatus bairdii TaxID=230844 RepID=UPI003FD22019